MRQLNFDLKMLCRRNCDGSFSTRANRERILTQMANQLHDLGYKNLRAKNLKQKHVSALLQLWGAEGLSSGTVKNRMSHLRWWTEKIGKQEVMFKDNSSYGIAKREGSARESKALDRDDEEVDLIKEDRIRISVKLQKYFGLRREEAMKVRPVEADQGSHIHLRGSWTKGGRERDIPIVTAEQRAVLEEAKAIAGKGSLIPPHQTYKKHLQRFELITHGMGIGRTHGFRHAYAQNRYEDLSGQKSPVQGGPRINEMTTKQKALDHDVRLQVSKELGHGRKEVMGAYLGGLVTKSKD